MADAEELELVRVHVSEPDCWTGCDFCCPFYDLEDIEESQWTWAAEEELELVLFGEYELELSMSQDATSLQTASNIMLKFIKAVRVRKSNDGEGPCVNALDSMEPCRCCGGFRTAANVEKILARIGGLDVVEEDVKRIRRFAMSCLREALSSVLPMELPSHVLDIMLDHIEASYSPQPQPPLETDWRFLEEQEANGGRSRPLKVLSKKLFNLFNFLKIHLFVNPDDMPTIFESELTKIHGDWTEMMNTLREITGNDE